MLCEAIGRRMFEEHAQCVEMWKMVTLKTLASSECQLCFPPNISTFSSYYAKVSYIVIGWIFFVQCCDTVVCTIILFLIGIRSHLILIINIFVFFFFFQRSSQVPCLLICLGNLIHLCQDVILGIFASPLLYKLPDIFHCIFLSLTFEDGKQGRRAAGGGKSFW